MNQVIQHNPLPSNVERLVDRIFEQLTASCPSIKYWSENEVIIAKQQWVLGLVENGIKTIEQVKAGMQALRAKDDDFVPSIGKFIKWCKQGNEYAHLGLPTAVELIQLYRKARSSCQPLENYSWKSAAEYHLVLRLQAAIYKHNLDDEKTLKRAELLISEAANFLINGGIFTEPAPRIEVKSVVVEAEIMSKKINELRAKLK